MKDKFVFFNNSNDFFEKLFDDIEKAKKLIYIETYIYANDNIGLKLKELLVKKLKEGIEVKLIIDSWGSEVNLDFFKEIISLNGDVKFFKKFKNYVYFFSHYHKRNHRKLAIIDNISYIGSSNIILNDWLESNLRINEKKLTLYFKEIFLQDYYNHKGFLNYLRFKKKYYKNFKSGKFEIVRDIPSLRHNNSLNKIINLINLAKDEILIETPYFLPPKKLIDSLINANKRKVKIKLFLPKISDVKLVDLLRRRYIKKLLTKNITVYFYNKISHSKLILIDRKNLAMGSVNLDYRSFYSQYEIFFVANSQRFLNKDVLNHFNLTLKNSQLVFLENLKINNFIHRFYEIIFMKIRRLF